MIKSLKSSNIILYLYVVLLLIGGFMGYVKGNSLPSLITATVAATLLCTFAVLKMKKVVFALLIALLAFFLYRFSLSWNVFPAGIIALLTLLVAWKQHPN